MDHCPMIGLRGIFHIKCKHPDGSIEQWGATNAPTHEGVRAMLDVGANSTIRPAPYNLNPSLDRIWMGLVSPVGFVAYSPGDTLALHPGWTEAAFFPGRQTGSAPLALTLGVAADGLSCTKEVSQDWDPTPNTVTARGLLIATSADDSGVLYSTADFNEGEKTIPAGSELEIIYTVTLGQ